MNAFLGCTRYCPRAMVDSIAVRLRKAEKTIGVLMPGQRRLPKTDVIFAWGATACVENAPLLSKSHATLVVFDCTERLSELNGLTIIDDSPHTPRECGTAIIEAVSTRAPKRVLFKHQVVDAIRPILEEKKSDGFLHRYNTLFYAISNKEAREKLRQYIFATMGGSMTAELFNTRAAELVPKRGKGRDSALGLIELVNSKDGERLRKALQAVLESELPVNKAVEAALKQFKVVSFDLRYLLAAVQKQRTKAAEKGGSNGKKSKGRRAPA